MNIISELSALFSIEEHMLDNFILTAPYRYKVYEIPKRNSTKTRTIAQPSSELKLFQKEVFERYFASLPVHDVCTAYVKGKSIRHNAIAHVGSKYLLKMDFSNFFSSIISSDLIEHLLRHKILEGEEVEENREVIERLFFYYQTRKDKLRLSMGAPTSPAISNTILYEFDCLVHDYCAERDVTYTRYADDLAFSTSHENILFDLPGFVEKTLEDIRYPRISLNKEKTVFLSKKHNMHLTGLVLTNDGKVSIGRAKKRLLKSQVHKYKHDLLSAEDKQQLSGYLSFCNSVEPEFITRLENKYTKKLIDEIMSE